MRKHFLMIGAMVLCLAVPCLQAANNLTWDANGTTAGRTDGAGAWLDANQWWYGVTNFSWASGDNATFGLGGAGGTVTLASPTTVGLLTFNFFSGTYTLGSAGNAITLNRGIVKNPGSGNVVLASPLILGASQTWTNKSGNIQPSGVQTLDNGGFDLTIDGAGILDCSLDAANTLAISGDGGIIKNGTGSVTLEKYGVTLTHSFTGDIILNGGSIYLKTASLLSGRNTKLNGGYLGFLQGFSGYTWSGLGTGADQIQITGGISGFSPDWPGLLDIQIGTAFSTLTWGSAFFNPSELFLIGNDARIYKNNISMGLKNGIDLNGSTRTFSSYYVDYGGGSGSGFILKGAIVNNTGTAGIVMSGIGNLNLVANNTYNGPTTISGDYTFIDVAFTATLPLSISLSDSGAINGTSALNLNGRGKLRLVNSAQANRFADTAPITSTGGAISYENTYGANVYSETLGAITLSSGTLDIIETTDQASTGSQTLTLGGVSRSGNAAVKFSAAVTGPQPSGNKNMILVTGAGNTAANEIIGPWATVGTAVNAQTDYAVYVSDYVTGLGAAATTDDSTWGTTWASTNNVNFANGTSGLTLTTTRNLNTLRHTGGSETLTVATGANLGTYGILNGSASSFTIAATGSGAVTLPTTDPGELHITTGSGDITINAPIEDNTGALTLIKNGTCGQTANGNIKSYGTLVLNGTNTFTGDIVINEGSVRIGTESSGNGARLGGSGGNYSGNITIKDGAILYYSSDADQELSGNISGAGHIVKSSSGTLTLSGNNTYTGKTWLSPTVNGVGAGIIEVYSFNSVVGGTASSSLGAPKTVENGTIEMGRPQSIASSWITIKYLGAGETTDRVINFSVNGGGRILDASGSGLLRFTSEFTGSVGGELHLIGSSNGQIDRGLPFLFPTLRKQGTGTWTLGGPVGGAAVTITAGILAVSEADCLRDDAAVSISSGAKLRLADGIKDKVGSLTLGGAAQDPGTYGSLSSNADNKSAYFDGTGVLYVGIDIPPPPPQGTIIIIQ